MQFVIDELSKSLRYHLRQLEENINKIERSEESIAMLKKKNLEHQKAIAQIEFYLDQLEKTEKAAT